MRNLVPIKIKVGLKPNGQADYPNFNKLRTVRDSGLDWAQYVDVAGLGWCYDKVSGHREEDATSPYGTQWGVLVVPQVFAAQAVAAFPALVTRITEIELEDFYDNRSRVQEPDEEINEKILKGIKLKQDLLQPLTVQQRKALDPNDDTPGIRKNRRKKWVDYKQLVNVNIV